MSNDFIRQNPVVITISCHFMGRIQKAIADKYESLKEIGAINQYDLAKRLHCSQAAVSHYLSGARGLTEKQIEQLCDALGVSFGDLEKPRLTITEPLDLKKCHYRLTVLYEMNRAGFKSVCRLIDDWIEESRSKEKAHDQPKGRSGSG